MSAHSPTCSRCEIFAACCFPVVIVLNSESNMVGGETLVACREKRVTSTY